MVRVKLALILRMYIVYAWFIIGTDVWELLIMADSDNDKIVGSSDYSSSLSGY